MTKVRQDKGHYQELVELQKKLKGQPSQLTDANHAYQAMEICFSVVDILIGKGMDFER